MKTKKIQVQINNIRHLEDKYVATLAMNGKPSDVDLIYASLGSNLKEGLALLNIDSRGSLPGALRGIEASYTYRDGVDVFLPVTLEISPSILTNIRIYAREEMDEEDYEPDNEVSFVREPGIKNLSTFRWLKGRMTGTSDGDTFTLVVNELGGKEIEISHKPVQVGDYVTVRLSGIDTRESRDNIEGVERAVDKNKNWLIRNGYVYDDDNMNKAFLMSAEAESVLKDYFMAGQELLVIVDDKADLWGNGYGIDNYGRIIGFAYDGTISINKTMLATWSNIFTRENLAEPYQTTEGNGEVASIFPISTWYRYSPAALEKRKERQSKVDPEEPVNIKDKFLKENELRLDKNGFLVYNNGEEISSHGFVSNSNAIPADSETLDYISHIHDDRDDLDGIAGISLEQKDMLYRAGFTRIGDCRLMVPPTSITISSVTNSRQVPTLRSSSSIQTQTGHVTRLIEMTLYFIGDKMINGEAMPSPVPGEQPWYRNGLRPLIAQFKAAPFIPIENSLINDSFGIYSVAFKDMEISTLPGYPDTIQVTLHLEEFDHTIFMPGDEYLAGSINWRMFRWYYQRFMQPSNLQKERTYLGRADLKDDKVSFFIPDEKALAERKQAIKDFQYKVEPHVYQESNKSEGSVGAGIEHDITEADSAKAQKYLFDRWVSNHHESNYPLTYQDHVFSPITLDRIELKGISEDEAKKYAIAYIELLSILYNKGENPLYSRNISEKYYSYDYREEINKISDFLDRYPVDKIEEIDQYRTGYFMPNNLMAMVELIEKYLSIDINVYGREIYLGVDLGGSYNYREQAPVATAKKSTFSGGFYVLDIESRQAQMYLSRMQTGYYEIKSHEAKQVFDMLDDQKDSISDSYDYYSEEFELLKEQARSTENDIPLVPFTVGGFITEGMSMQMSKIYSKLQLQQQETPTLQYLGSQDSTVVLQIAGLDRYAVEQFQQLLRTTQRLARDYRIAITSGVLTIENEMFKLLGIRDFLIKSIEVKTSEDKETFKIIMALTAFSKTQRLSETLEEISLGEFIDTDKDSTMDQVNAYFDQRRENEDFETGIVDIELRNAEVYPDMELPTYTELNHALRYLNIYDSRGRKFLKMPNPSNGRFLDPDFYIRSVNTRRENIIDMLENDTPGVYTMDDVGFSSIEWGPSPNQERMEGPNVWFSDETVQWINEYLEEVNFGNTFSNNIDLMGTYTEFQKNIIDHTNIGSVEATYGEEFSDYLHSAKNASIKSAVTRGVNYKAMTSYFSAKDVTGITDDELLRGGDILDAGRVDKKLEMARMSIKNPSHGDVHRELYKLVKEYWPGLVDEYSDEEDISIGSKMTRTYLYGSNRISAPVITVEKVLNTIKAVFHVESNWKQFSTGTLYPTPRYNPNNGNLGISGVSINCGLFSTKTEIREAAWDWKVNIRKGVEYFAWCYNKAIEDSNPDTSGNPLDWAVAFYYEARRGQDPDLGKNNILDTDHFYGKFRNIFCQKYGVDVTWFLAVPDTIMDPTLSDDLDNQALIQHVTDDVIAAEAAGGYKGNMSDNPTLSETVREELRQDRTIAEGFTDNVTVMTIKAAKYKWNNSKMEDLAVFNRLQQMGEDSTWTENTKDRTFAVYDPYGQRDIARGEDWLLEDKKNFKPLVSGMDIVEDTVYRHLSLRYDVNTDEFGPVDENQNAVIIKDGAYEKIASAYARGDFDVEKIYQFLDFDDIYTIANIEKDKDIIDDAAQAMRTKVAVSLVVFEEDSIAEMYRSGYNDLLEYDQRGRLLRAFPTFQMFIIDEGRWMTWHKLWDKFYGYNSILSIDVMKDRRMAADTAIIEMSNIYHNLSTQDSSVSYGEWELRVTDLLFGNPEDKARVWNEIWGLPDDEIIRAYRENMSSLVLKPGARIHLRLGYGSNAYKLPIVFNGTIAEMNTGEIITVVAQGDGIELTNKIASNPDETTDGGMLQAIKEPRAMICEMLTSKGGFFKNVLNRMSHGIFFNANPLGITHFGSPIAPMSLVIPNLLEGEEDFGEAGLNVYAGAGINTLSQWIHTEGPKRGDSIGINWDGMPWAEGDEPSVNIYLFDKTPWDMVQIYSSVCPDYIATVLPFEFRSTLFFGKPHWGVVDKYEYQYRWDDKTSMLVKEPISARRKSLTQFKFYTSYEDIIKNDIKATDMHMYTNVVGVYDEGGKKTMTIQADSDIYTEKQTTAIVDVPIKASGLTNFWTQEKYAISAAASTLSNYIREMYQGELTVLGDPTAKPHDTMFIGDTFSEMSGNAWIKRVVHHFSMETGFVTNITPDCINIVDDRQVISHQQWFAGSAINMTAGVIGLATASRVEKMYTGRIIADTVRKYGKDGVDKVIVDLIINGIDDPEAKRKTIRMMDDLHIREELIGLFNGLDDKSTREVLSAVSKGIATNIDDVIDILDATDRSVLSTVFKVNRTVGTGVSKSIGKIASYISDAEGSADIITDINNAFDSASKLGKSMRFFQDKGLIKTPVQAVVRTGGSVLKGTAKLTGGGAVKILKGATGIIGSRAVMSLLSGVVADIAFTVVAETVIETWQRYLKSRQAVLIMPLRYRGREFTAGINGHRGAVLGDSPGKVDKFLEGSGYLGGLVDVLNGIAGIEVDYSSSEYDREYLD